LDGAGVGDRPIASTGVWGAFDEHPNNRKMIKTENRIRQIISDLSPQTHFFEFGIKEQWFTF
jgi:hypothetical protein